MKAAFKVKVKAWTCGEAIEELVKKKLAPAALRKAAKHVHLTIDIPAKGPSDERRSQIESIMAQICER